MPEAKVIRTDGEDDADPSIIARASGYVAVGVAVIVVFVFTHQEETAAGVVLVGVGSFVIMHPSETAEMVMTAAPWIARLLVLALGIVVVLGCIGYFVGRKYMDEDHDSI